MLGSEVLHCILVFLGNGFHGSLINALLFFQALREAFNLLFILAPFVFLLVIHINHSFRYLILLGLKVCLKLGDSFFQFGGFSLLFLLNVADALLHNVFFFLDICDKQFNHALEFAF